MKRKIKIQVPDAESVGGIIQLPDNAWALMVLAHGAGAGMEHRFMEDVAKLLEKEGIGTLRFNFLYMEKGGGRPDLPHVAHKVIRAAVSRAQEYADGIPVVGAGKSFGGRMFSELMSKDDAPDVKALVFYGFPLHAPGKQGKERAAHLSKVNIPMLFLQGTRDSLAQIDLMKEVVKAHKKATIEVIDQADHSFHVPKKSGKTDAEVLDAMNVVAAKWLNKTLFAIRR